MLLRFIRHYVVCFTVENRNFKMLFYRIEEVELWFTLQNSSINWYSFIKGIYSQIWKIRVANFQCYIYIVVSWTSNKNLIFSAGRQLRPTWSLFLSFLLLLTKMEERSITWGNSNKGTMLGTISGHKIAQHTVELATISFLFLRGL